MGTERACTGTECVLSGLVTATGPAVGCEAAT